jgi:hypothetical protein
MDNDKLAWFGGGVVVGLLVGLGIAAGFGYSKLAEVEARSADAEDRAAAEAMHAARSARVASENERKARMQVEAAEKAARDALQQLKKQNPEEKTDK